MSKHTRRIAVFPGAFDPVTNGHMDVIIRGRELFDELVVAVGHNPQKQDLFTPAQRVEMLRGLVVKFSNVRVDSYTGLTVDYAKKVGATVILRGIRNAGDLQFELQMAQTNREVAGIDTVFIMTDARYAFISSSLIKQVAAMGGDVSSLVPTKVAERIRTKVASDPSSNKTKGKKGPRAKKIGVRGGGA
ncbi:MAG: pantetheine-phosphate adenylyltransferase [Planctomycetes bacterium]|nr:pantetheine-phosphate adenylyltransferase [Planctomycetota bacterium]